MNPSPQTNALSYTERRVRSAPPGSEAQSHRHLLADVRNLIVASDASIQLQRHGAKASRCDGHHACKPTGNVGLVFVIASPRHDGAIAFQCHGVKASRCDGHHAVQSSGNPGLA